MNTTIVKKCLSTKVNNIPWYDIMPMAEEGIECTVDNEIKTIVKIIKFDDSSDVVFIDKEGNLIDNNEFVILPTNLQ